MSNCAKLVTVCRKPSLKCSWCVGLLTVNVEGCNIPFYSNLSSYTRRGEWGERIHPRHACLWKCIQIYWAPGHKHWQTPAYGWIVLKPFPPGSGTVVPKKAFVMASKHLWSKQHFHYALYLEYRFVFHERRMHKISIFKMGYLFFKDSSYIFISMQVNYKTFISTSISLGET